MLKGLMNIKNNLIHAYHKLKLSKQFSISYVDGVLKEKYKAVEVDVKELGPLFKNDQYADVNKFAKAYFLNDPAILNNLFSQKERQTQKQINVMWKQFEEQGVLKPLSRNAPNYDMDKRHLDIASGKLIVIALETDDGEHLSGSKQLGECRKISSELIVYEGIKPEQCREGNEYFEFYLNALVTAGFLSR